MKYLMISAILLAVTTTASALPLPTKKVTSKLPQSNFSVWQRTPQLKRQDCQSCHATKKRRVAKPHKEINLVHAANQGMSCQTCHHKPKVWLLKNPSNQETMAIDHAYLSCQGCHASQVKDWAGGAHGKRVARWQGERVIYNCTQCHNPHDPRHEKRWPKTHSSLPEH